MHPPKVPPVEILDVLWACDEAGERLPARRSEAVRRLRAAGQDRAAALVAGIAARDDVLDEEAVNEVFLAVHLELARLSEFVSVPQRMASVLKGLIDRMRERTSGPIRVVDVGCGIGYNLRVIADSGQLGDDVEFVGVDLNGLLVQAARQLAKAENVDARFEHGDAMSSTLAVEDPPRTIMISSALVHHLGAENLPDFLRRHDAMGVAAFAHFDVDPGPWANLGAWMLHRAWMREPISRHDGALSIRRSLKSDVLLELAREALGGRYALECETFAAWLPRPSRIVRPLIGVRT